MSLAEYQVTETRTGAELKQTSLRVSGEECKVSLLTGGIDPHYALGMTRALTAKGVNLDVIGNTEMDTPEMHGVRTLNFLDLHGNLRKKTTSLGRHLRHLAVYKRLIWYAATAKTKIFHILWNYRFQLFDRTLLLLFYKALGKKLVFTAHNVNAAERDGTESLLNRWSLRAQYHLVDHIFVHTDKMKDELVDGFGVAKGKVSVIPFGTYDCVPNTGLTSADAKRKLGLERSEKVVLFFGRILPYKGLDYLVDAFIKVAPDDKNTRLIIAGEPKKESVQCWREIQQKIDRGGIGDRVIQKIGFIANEDIELYFKAADVLVLPYTLIFQSGVLFMAYSFGLPVIASDVGSMREDIFEGETGFICRPCDSSDLANTMEMYFRSSLFATLDQRREEIMAFARARNSWTVVGEMTSEVYSRLLENH